MQGFYELGDSRGGFCGGAPMCFNPDERVSWIPTPLAPWGKLPAWVAAFLSSTKAEHAVMISEARFEAARRELSRVFKEARPASR
jgi:thioesterase domain-containing protein